MGLLDVVIRRLENLLLGDLAKPTQVRAARSLGRIGTPLCVSILQQAVLDPRLPVQFAAVEGLSASVNQSRPNQQIIDKLVELLGNKQGTRKVRLSAAKLLMRYRVFQILPRLEKMLEITPGVKAKQPIRFALKGLQRQGAIGLEAMASVDSLEAIELSSSTPFDPQVFRHYAKLLVRQRRYREAKEVSELIVGHTKLANDYRHYARLLSIVGKEANAEFSFQTAIQLDPDNETIKQDFAYFLIKNGRGREACHILKPLVETTDSGEARVRLNYAEALAMIGRVEEAESEFRTAVQKWSEYPIAHNAYANFLKDHGRLLEAKWQYLSAIELAKDNGVYANNYGTLLVQLGDYEVAEAQFLKAIQLDPTFPWAYYQLANLYTNQNKLTEVIKVALRGIPCFLKYEDYQDSFYLAELALKCREYNEAEKHLAVELSIVATTLALLNNLPEDTIIQLLESVAKLWYQPLRPLVGCLYNRIAEKVINLRDEVVPLNLSPAEFTQVQELVSHSCLWHAEMCSEILRIFSEEVDEWNMAIAGLIVDVGI